MMPRPTQRCIPEKPLWRHRFSPCRRLTTLMRPSHPVRHFWPFRNQRFFCSRWRARFLVARLGDADAFDTERLGSGLVFGGVEPSVRRKEARGAAQYGLMELYGGYQKIGVVWPRLIDFVALREERHAFA